MVVSQKIGLRLRVLTTVLAPPLRGRRKYCQWMFFLLSGNLLMCACGGVGEGKGFPCICSLHICNDLIKGLNQSSGVRRDEHHSDSDYEKFNILKLSSPTMQAKACPSHPTKTPCQQVKL